MGVVAVNGLHNWGVGRCASVMSGHHGLRIDAFDANVSLELPSSLDRFETKTTRRIMKTNKYDPVPVSAGTIFHRAVGFLGGIVLVVIGRP
jgi:hypothetical protein